MSFIDTRELKIVERRPGWRGRAFHSANMTFVHYEFDAGASIHEHHHPEEEVWNVIEGQLEVTVGGETRVAGAGCAALVPADAPHAVKALTAGRAIVVDQPLRGGFG
jgi:quercetin dioxygenase-like cupin family protein